MKPSSMWAATPCGAKISRASASGNPRQRSETPRHTFLARCVQRMDFLPRPRGATRSRIGNSRIRMTRSLNLTMISYVSRGGFPIAAPGLEARQPSEPFHFERCKGTKLAQVVAGPGYVAKLQIGLADARLGRWNRADDDACASRHRLRGRVGRWRDLWPLRHNRLFAGLRAFRAQSDPGARTGLLPRGRYIRGRCPAIGRRSASRDRDRRRDGACLRGDPYHRGDCSARFRNRAAVEADPLRLHEWNRADRADQSATQTVRI